MRLSQLFKLISFIFLFGNFPSALAAVDDNDIILQPYVRYLYVNSNVPSQLSADALVVAINEYQARLKAECLATQVQCATHIVTGYRITEGSEGNDPYDETVRYTLLSTHTLTRNGNVIDTSERETKGLMYSDPECPRGTNGLRIDNSKYMCIQTVPNLPPPSCPTQFQFGNPIDVATLEKRDHEIDFSTGDGLLTLERFYVNQYQGWEFGVPRQLINYELPPSQNSACYWASNGPALVKNYCFKYMNYQSATRTVSLSLRSSDGGRLLFRRSGNGFVATNSHSGKIQTYNQDGFSWVYTKPDNSKEFYSASGLLKERQTAIGRKIFYDYNGDKIVRIRDDSGRSISFVYDETHRINKAILPDGNEITYSYDEFNNITKVVWPDGHHKSYLYNETEQMVATDLSNPFHFMTGKINEKGIRNGTYIYAAGGLADSTEKADGIEKYDIFGSTTIIDPLDSKLVFTFKTLDDGTRLLRKQSQPAGSGCNASSQYLAYNTDGLVTQRKEFNGNLTQYGYNENKLENVRVEGVTTTATTLSDTAVLPYLVPNAVLPTGIRKISTDWHPDWRVKTRIAEANKITTNIYNGQPDPFNSNQIVNCAPASVTAPLLCKKVVQATTDANGAAGFTAVLDTTLASRVWQYTYNDLGKTLTVITPQSALTNSVETTYEYYTSDSSDWRKGDLKQISNALGHTTQFTRYDANGRVLEMIDPNNVQLQFTYDLRGRLLTSSRGTETTAYQYDPVGNLIRVTQPDGVYLEYDYDNASRLIRIRDAQSNQIEYTLDKASNITNISMSGSGGLKYQQQRVYDALSRVQNIINANANSTTLKYDASGNLTSEVDAKNQTTSQTYDGLDQFKQRTDALSGKINYTFDAQGNLTSVKDPRNNTTSYKYNAFGDLVEQTSPDTGKTTFAYDAAGNRISSTDARGVTQTYVYDGLNRLTAIQYPSATENITYRYDGAMLPANDSVYAKGQLTSLVMSSMQWDFIYNAQGQLSKKRVQLLNINSSTEYVYNTAGRVTRVIYPSGRIVNYDYDVSGNVSNIRTQANSNATETLVMSNVNYLPFGPAESFTYGNGLTHSQTYDLNYRLTSIQVGGILHRDYVYDAVSNITGITNNINNTETQTLNYDALNRLTSALGGYGNLIYTYDAVGNRLTESRNSLVDTYSYATTSNRLNSITRSTGNRSFTYDNAGNPTQRTSDDNKTHNNTFNNSNRLSSVNVNGSLAATYTYNPLGQRVVKTLANGTQEIYHYDEAGQLLSVTDASGTTQREYIYFGNQQIAMLSNNNVYYIHNDHLNTPQVVTNQSQQVVWMGNYEPFGKLAANQSNSIEIFSRFPGQYFDAETNLYYNYFRDYDPSIGRYIESDPIGLGGGINTYAYVGGNPLSFSDPFGLSAEDISISLNQLKREFPELKPKGWYFQNPQKGNGAETDPWSGIMYFPENWSLPKCLTYNEYTDRLETIFHESMHSTDSRWRRITTFDEGSLFETHHTSMRNRSRWEVGWRQWGTQPPTNSWGTPRLPDKRVNKEDLYEEYRRLNPDCICENK